MTLVRSSLTWDESIPKEIKCELLKTQYLPRLVRGEAIKLLTENNQKHLWQNWPPAVIQTSYRKTAIYQENNGIIKKINSFEELQNQKIAWPITIVSWLIIMAVLFLLCAHLKLAYKKN